MSKPWLPKGTFCLSSPFLSILLSLSFPSFWLCAHCKAAWGAVAYLPVKFDYGHRWHGGTSTSLGFISQGDCLTFTFFFMDPEVKSCTLRSWWKLIWLSIKLQPELRMCTNCSVDCFTQSSLHEKSYHLWLIAVADSVNYNDVPTMMRHWAIGVLAIRVSINIDGPGASSLVCMIGELGVKVCCVSLDPDQVCILYTVLLAYEDVQCGQHLAIDSLQRQIMMQWFEQHQGRNFLVRTSRAIDAMQLYTVRQCSLGWKNVHWSNCSQQI